MNRFYQAGWLCIALSGVIGLSACSSESEIIDSIDDVPTPHYADVRYINMTSSAADFYTRSTVYPESTFADRHWVVEVNEIEASAKIRHDWIAGENETEFGVQQSITHHNRATTTAYLSHGQAYWHAVIEYGAFPELSVFPTKSAISSENYTVRILSNRSPDVAVNNLVQLETEILAGIVSEQFEVQQCQDLTLQFDDMVSQEFTIDLCQTGQPGKAYLVVLDAIKGYHLVLNEGG